MSGWKAFGHCVKLHLFKYFLLQIDMFHSFFHPLENFYSQIWNSLQRRAPYAQVFSEIDQLPSKRAR